MQSGLSNSAATVDHYKAAVMLVFSIQFGQLRFSANKLHRPLFMINQFMINRLILSAQRAEKSIPRWRFFLPVFRQQKQDPQIILPAGQNTGNLYHLILNAAEQEIVSAE